MREEFMSLIAAILLWIVFASLNELKNANETGECCEKGRLDEAEGCGKSMIDKTIWALNLGAAIVFTLYFLYQIYEEYAN